MNDYEVTYANGEVVVITAWTPEAALAIADEDGDLYGCPSWRRTPRTRKV
jgi:hypothetical protein